MLRRALACSLLLAFACAPPPLPAPPPQQPAEEPFGVLSVSARGALDAPPEEVTVVFTRSMHPIESPTSDASAIGRLERATDHQPIAGSWTWFGSRTAVFRAEHPLANATSFVLTIPAGTQALDGARLAGPEVAEFSTPRPRLNDASYVSGQDVGSFLPGVTVSFNIPVAAAEVERALHIEGRRKGAAFRMPFKVDRSAPAKDPSASFSTIGDASLTTAEKLTVVAASGLVSPEGPLASEQEVRMDAPVLGPLKVTLDCTLEGTACDPLRGVQLQFSKEVRGDSLLSHLETRPKAKIDKSGFYEEMSSLDLSSVFPLEPRSKLRVVLHAGLVAVDGEKLEDDRTIDFEIGDKEPSISTGLLSEAIVEAARFPLAFAVHTVNMENFDFECAPFSEAALIARLASERAQEKTPGELGETAGWVRGLPGATSREIRPVAARNVTATSHVEIPASMRPKGGFGLFAVGLRTPAGYRARLASVTDLGLTTKWGPYGGLVWVTRLSSGAPVAGAEVRVVDLDAPDAKLPAVAPTDAQGIAELPHALGDTLGEHAAVVLVRAGADWSYARLPPTQPQLPLGLLFTERRLYRPGETVYGKGYFRIPGDDGRLEAPVGREVEVELHVGGHMIHAEKATLDAFGAFSVAIGLPRTARGYASLEARPLLPATAGAAPKPQGQAYANFDVEDYRSVEFKVDVATDRLVYTRGDVAKLDISAQYLFGAPMHGVPVRTWFRRESARFEPVGFDAFSFADDVFSTGPGGDPRGKGTATVGAGGRVETSVALDLADQRGAEVIDFEADVDDVGQSFIVSGYAKGVFVHPGDFYLGLRVPDEPKVVAGDRVPVETVAVVPHGKQGGERRAKVPVHLALYKGPFQTLDPAALRSTTPRPSAADVPSGGGRAVEDTPIAQCDAMAGEPLPRTCALVARDDGAYAVLGTTRDDHGRTLYASTELHVWQKGMAPAPPPRVPRAPKVESFEARCKEPARTTRMLFERDRYAPGDSGRLCVATEAPRALFTLDREGVLRHEVWDVGKARNPISIAITPDLEPDADAELDAVSGRRGPVPEREEGSRRPLATSAAKLLRVQRPDKALAVAIVPRVRRVHPGDAVEVDLSVTDGKGRPAPAQVTFFAVDEGVDLLRPYEPPRPEVFWESRGSKIRTSDTRHSLYWEPLFGVGHGTGAGSIRQGATNVNVNGIGRKSIVPVAVFRPGILTGPDGKATVRFTLPHNTTTWKLHAFAANGADGFGGGDGELVASKDFLTRPSLPRFLRAGDRLVASAVVDSTVDADERADESFSAAGAARASGRAALDVPPDGHVPVGFDMTADRSGRTDVVFALTGSGPARGALDSIELSLPVHPPWELETVAFSGVTKSVAREPLSVQDRRLDAGGLEYRLAATPLVALAEGFEQLLDYPYGCTEQLVSRLVPLVALRGVAERYGLPLPTDADEKAREAVDALLSHQSGSGGFGAWDRSTENPWLTGYALWGLSVAKEAGLLVSDAAVSKAFLYMAGHPGRPEDAALTQDVLAAYGQPDEKEIKRLAALDALPIEARALLAHAAAKVDPEVARSLLAAIPVRASGAGATVAPGDFERSFPSSTARATALVLRAFTAVQPQHPMIPDLVRGLLSLRRGGRWASTQDAAWAALALSGASAAVETGPRDVVVRLGGVVVDHVTLPASGLVEHEGALAMSSLAPASALSFQSATGAPVYYEAFLRSAPRDPPAAALSHGLQVDRSYRVVGADGVPHAGPIHVGDSILIDVYATSAAGRDQVVVVDPLPAGFEPVTGTFATEARGPGLAQSHFDHREFRDDRVLTFVDRMRAETLHFAYRARATTAGTFQRPPARAECMYAPDVFGRTEASVVRVEPPTP